MPIIDNNAVPMTPPEDGRSSRRFVNKEAGPARMYTIFPTDNPTTEYVD